MKLRLGIWMSDPYLYYNSIKDTPVCGHLDFNCLKLKNEVKGIYNCPIVIIKGLTDMGQFEYLTKLKGTQVGNYLYTTQFLSLR